VTRLRRVDCSGPGIVRRRAGRGFAYFDEDGARVTEPEVLERIHALVLPPAWTEVWICPYPMGHIQAVGTDAAGRRQYRYHDVWRTRRDQEKFDHMLEFAEALPTLRSTICEHLQHRGLTRNRVLACATRLLDLGFFRIGTEGYAEQNQTYGLATMRKRHVKLASGDLLEFDYIAKSGKRRIQSIVDPDVYRVVRTLKQRSGGGHELLAWKAGREWRDVKSVDINDYVREITGGDFTAKDFRTWNATVLAAVALAVSSETAGSKTARKKAEARAVKEVAHYLGNTPAVCRASYIDPRVIDRYRAGITVSDSLHRLGAETRFGQVSTQGPVEDAVLDLLSDAPPARLAA
jgi:DNA topoisomerase-1